MKDINELKQIALDLAMGKIFCSHFIAEYEMDIITSVFIPLALGGLSKMSKEEVEDIGMIYEYLIEASPRCINNYPVFLSCKMLNKAETEIVLNMATTLKQSYTVIT